MRVGTGFGDFFGLGLGERRWLGSVLGVDDRGAETGEADGDGITDGTEETEDTAIVAAGTEPDAAGVPCRA